MVDRSTRYVIEGSLGAGGMAEVFRAHLEGALGFRRTVAIKRMLPGLSRDAEFQELFRNEARIASLLVHPNIVSVFDFDIDDEGQLFLVMELIEGRDLHAVAARGLLPLSVSIFIGAELFRALSFAHHFSQDGKPLCVIHRDISPSNVLLSFDGAVKLSDFGIAKAAEGVKASKSGIKGKMAYLSPEQINCLDLDGRSDLFSVGVVLHELVTGGRLFALQGAAEPMIMYRVLEHPVPPPRDLNPSCSEALEAVILKLLERDRDRRFQSASEALEALLSCPEATPRGALELSHLLRERFPGPVQQEAGGRPDGDRTPSLHTGTRRTNDERGRTLDEGPRREATPRRSTIEAFVEPLEGVRTPTATPALTFSNATKTRPDRPRSGTVVLALVVAGLIAAIGYAMRSSLIPNGLVVHEAKPAAASTEAVPPALPLAKSSTEPAPQGSEPTKEATEDRSPRENTQHEVTPPKRASPFSRKKRAAVRPSAGPDRPESTDKHDAPKPHGEDDILPPEP